MMTIINGSIEDSSACPHHCTFFLMKKQIIKLEDILGHDNLQDLKKSGIGKSDGRSSFKSISHA
jgi:hypothetical protein